MIDVLRIAHLRIAPQEGNSEVGNCEVHLLLLPIMWNNMWKWWSAYSASDFRKYVGVKKGQTLYMIVFKNLHISI